jgi:5'-phosphate synthase pdxT subunit
MTASSVPRAGVLALQGGFAAHVRALEREGCEAVEIRRPEALADLDGLVIPGGESTTLLKFLEFEPRWESAILDFHRSGKCMFGTCAGLILLARDVVEPAQHSLGCLDITVVRNGYGRQKESFIYRGVSCDGREMEMVFIRAPRIRSVGGGVNVLAEHRGEPVLIRQGSVLGATFHPELSSNSLAHEEFVAGMRRLDVPKSSPV